MANFNEKYFGGEAKPYDAEQLLAEGEQILWRAKPKRNAFILNKVFRMMPIALLWLLIDGGVIAGFVATGAFTQAPVFFKVFIVCFFAVHLIPVWIWISGIVSAGIAHKNMEYVFTDKRIILKSGVIGVDVNNIYYSDISNVNLRVGLLDKLLHVGDIYISGTGKAQVLWDIENPYPVTTRLQKIVNDIKTDTYFPNELRPDSNEGYRTKYTGKTDL